MVAMPHLLSNYEAQGHKFILEITCSYRADTFERSYMYCCAVLSYFPNAVKYVKQRKSAIEQIGHKHKLRSNYDPLFSLNISFV